MVKDSIRPKADADTPKSDRPHLGNPHQRLDPPKTEIPIDHLARPAVRASPTLRRLTESETLNDTCQAALYPFGNLSRHSPWLIASPSQLR